MGARGRRRFALAELVVTTAVVVVLASLLLPVFARARDEARQAASPARYRSNEKETQDEHRP